MDELKSRKPEELVATNHGIDAFVTAVTNIERHTAPTKLKDALTKFR